MDTTKNGCCSGGSVSPTQERFCGAVVGVADNTKQVQAVSHLDILEAAHERAHRALFYERARLSAIAQTKQFRKELDFTLQALKASPRRSAEREESIKNLKQAIMWLGMDLKEIGTPTPYPHSYDPSSPIVDKAEVTL